MIICLHTTESDPGSLTGVVNYLNARPDSQPHVAYDPSTVEDHTFLPASQNAKALQHPAGTPETNNRAGGVFQVEIVGRAADVGGYDSAWYHNLQTYLAQWAAILKVPYVFHPDRTRFTAAQWADPALQGIIEHCHVPNNDHSDCGTLDHRRLELALTLQVAAATQEAAPDMDITTIYTDKTTVNDRALWTGDAVKRIEETDIPAIQADLAAVKNTLQALLTVANATSQAPKASVAIDYILLANTVADVLAQRMAK